MTTLKGSVQNDDLEVFGLLSFDVEATSISSSYNKLTIEVSEPVKLSVDGGGYFAYNVNDLSTPSSCKTEDTITDSTTIYFGTGTYKGYIDNKYAITKFMDNQGGSVVHINIKEFEWCTDMLDFRVSSGSDIGNLSDFSKMSSLQTLICRFNIYGEISSLLGCTELNYIKIDSNTKLTNQQISTFGTLLKLGTIDFTGTYGLNGTVESYAAAQVAAGRTTGTTVIKGTNNITYNGSGIAGRTVTVTFNSSLSGGYSVSVA